MEASIFLFVYFSVNGTAHPRNEQNFASITEEKRFHRSRSIISGHSRVHAYVTEWWMTRSETLPPSSRTPSGRFTHTLRRRTLAWLSRHEGCRLNNYPHSALNPRLTTWNPSTEFARPRLPYFKAVPCWYFKGESLINTRRPYRLLTSFANFAAFRQNVNRFFGHRGLR